jgi:hypothetical protein
MAVCAVVLGACVQIKGYSSADGGGPTRQEGNAGAPAKARPAESGSGGGADSSSESQQASDGSVEPSAEVEAGASAPAPAATDGMMSVPQAPEGALGAACASPTDCDNGQCVRSVCCSVAACGVCEVCGATGNCEKVINAYDPLTCVGESAFCDATGACVLAEGALCVPPNVLPCASGLCDTFCCLQACGPCQQCGASGQCESLPFGDDESCFGPTSCSGGLCAEIDQASTERVLNLTLGAGEILAQTVTIAKTGKLIEVRLTPGCGRALALRSLTTATGVPAETALAESIRSTVHTDGLSESFEFNLDVTSNQRLALVLRNDQGSDCNVPVGTGNPYVGGGLLSWNADDRTWAPVADNDMTFKLLLVH